MIKLLDCTLRDGCHVNSGEFGYQNIKQLVSELSYTGLDYVEIGFLKNIDYDSNLPFYPEIEYANELLEQIDIKQETKFALMARADSYDLKKISDCNGRINLIRVAFYYEYLDKAIDYAKEIKDKGYDVTLNLINTPGHSFNELSRLIAYANNIEPKVLTIVDTFGVLDEIMLDKILEFYTDTLNKNITLGLHAHENLGLSFALAKYFINYCNQKRDIVVDGSIAGMGRIPGNLPIELILDYLNNKFDKEYILENVLSLIEQIIMPIKTKTPWGYSPAYFLSAKHKVHRSYAEELLRLDMDLKTINLILSVIDEKYAEKFNKDYIDVLINKERVR